MIAGSKHTTNRKCQENRRQTFWRHTLAPPPVTLVVRTRECPLPLLKAAREHKLLQKEAASVGACNVLSPRSHLQQIRTQFDLGTQKCSGTQLLILPLPFWRQAGIEGGGRRVRRPNGSQQSSCWEQTLGEPTDNGFLAALLAAQPRRGARASCSLLTLKRSKDDAAKQKSYCTAVRKFDRMLSGSGALDITSLVWCAA